METGFGLAEGNYFRWIGSIAQDLEYQRRILAPVRMAGAQEATNRWGDGGIITGDQPTRAKSETDLRYEALRRGNMAGAYPKE